MEKTKKKPIVRGMMFNSRYTNEMVSVTSVKDGVVTLSNGKRYKKDDIRSIYKDGGWGRPYASFEAEVKDDILYIDGEAIQMGSLKKAKVLSEMHGTVYLTVKSKDSDLNDLFTYNVFEGEFKPVAKEITDVSVLYRAKNDNDITILKLVWETNHKVARLSEDGSEVIVDVTGYEDAVYALDPYGRTIWRLLSIETEKTFGRIEKMVTEEGENSRSFRAFDIGEELSVLFDTKGRPFHVKSGKPTFTNMYVHGDCIDKDNTWTWFGEVTQNQIPSHIGKVVRIEHIPNANHWMMIGEDGVAVVTHYYKGENYHPREIIEGNALEVINTMRLAYLTVSDDGKTTYAFFEKEDESGVNRITEIRCTAGTDRGYVTEVINH